MTQMSGNALNVQQSRDMLMYEEPYSSANAMPADSAWATAWGGSWVDIGFTDGGLRFNVATTFADVHVDQVIDPVLVVPTARDIRLAGTMAEFTTGNIKTATGQGTSTTTAATSGVRGHTDLAFDNTIALSYLTAGFDVHASGDNESFRPVAWRAQARGNPQVQFSATAKATIPFELECFPDPNNSNRILTLRKILAALWMHPSSSAGGMAPPKRLRFSVVPRSTIIEIERPNPIKELENEQPTTIVELVAWPQGDGCPAWIAITVEAAHDTYREAVSAEMARREAAGQIETKTVKDPVTGEDVEEKNYVGPTHQLSQALATLRRDLLCAVIEGLAEHEAALLIRSGGPWEDILVDLGWWQRRTTAPEPTSGARDPEGEAGEATEPSSPA
jgi:hypothetical protein